MRVVEVPLEVLRAAFDTVVAQWPTEVTPGAKTFHVNGGCNMRELNEVHSRVEEALDALHFDGLVDDVVGSAEHYVYSTIHDALKNLTLLRTSDLDFEAFASRFDSNPNYCVVRI